ncbi:MAG TPA: FAD-dependent oxidoreductase [Stellaceae bacterium]|nr:FAD-dependent oxidoreductase [Stellaceae bacterium]
MTADRERLVVVGNGMAGARLIEALVAGAPHRFDIAVFGADPRPAYNRILLSAVLAGETEHGDIAIQPHDWYAEHGIALFTGDAVVAIDPVARRVISAAGRRRDYDRLVLATGSRPLAPPIAGLGLPGVCAFRDLADVETMIAAAATGARAVVIGGGLLGLEAAWGLRRRGMAATVVHLMPIVMERQLDAVAAQLLQRDLAARGIRLVTDAVTEEICGDDRARAVRLATGEEIPADLVVVAIGIRPEIGLARQAGIEVNRGILVGDDLCTSDAGIYAVGECAEHRGRCYGLVPPLWDMAETCAARLAGDSTARFAAQVPATRLKITGIEVFSAGALMAEAQSDDEITLHDEAAGTYRKLVVRDGRIVGAVLYGDIADSPWYQGLIGDGDAITTMRGAIAFGRAAAVEHDSDLLRA